MRGRRWRTVGFGGPEGKGCWNSRRKVSGETKEGKERCRRHHVGLEQPCSKSSLSAKSRPHVNTEFILF